MEHTTDVEITVVQGTVGETVVAVATSTRPATSTSAPTQIPTPTSIATSAATYTPTPLPVLVPTSTPTRAATRTPSPTNVPTSMPTSTSTPRPTSTSVPTSTATPLPQPTNTPRPRATSTPTATPDRSTPALTISKLPTTARVVALTFDAGADVGYTTQILDTLRAEGVKASFGITGKWAEANPALVRRIADEGHMFINHTYSHRSLTGRSTGESALSYDERADELWKTHSMILNLTGVSSKPYFRPPYGDYDETVLADVRSRGYTYNIMWSVDSLGWKGLSKEQIVDRVMTGLEPGAIYLFHVGSQSQDGPALPTMISTLGQKGYSFARVSDYYP